MNLAPAATSLQRLPCYPPLILASASPRRKELLAEMGIRFRVDASDAEEVQPRHLTPGETAQLNALRKAIRVSDRHAGELVLAADTSVCLPDRIFGKPVDLDDAERMLLQLQGREHWVITGVCLRQRDPAAGALFMEVTRVEFWPLSRAQIRDYLRRINPLDKAGAYAIQEHGERLIKKISGSRSNVVGLPTQRLAAILSHIGRKSA
jgi:septum formation protein